jgi:hypothetical protein
MDQSTVKAPKERLLIACSLMTAAFLASVPFCLRLAESWNERTIWVADNYFVKSHIVPLSLASLTIICVGLIVTWTGFRRGSRAAWFVLLVITGLYYLPVLVFGFALSLNWTNVFENLAQNVRDSTIVRESFYHLIGFVLMLVALLLPFNDFFFKRNLVPRESLPD